METIALDQVTSAEAKVAELRADLATIRLRGKRVEDMATLAAIQRLANALRELDLENLEFGDPSHIARLVEGTVGQ